MSVWTENITAEFHQKILSGCLEICKIRQGITFFCRTLYSTFVFVSIVLVFIFFRFFFIIIFDNFFHFPFCFVTEKNTVFNFAWVESTERATKFSDCSVYRRVWSPLSPTVFQCLSHVHTINSCQEYMLPLVQSHVTHITFKGIFETFRDIRPKILNCLSFTAK